MDKENTVLKKVFVLKKEIIKIKEHCTNLLKLPKKIKTEERINNI